MGFRRLKRFDRRVGAMIQSDALPALVMAYGLVLSHQK
jgi:hypothetical protein